MLNYVVRFGALIAVCGALGACAGNVQPDNYAAVSCSTPGAIMESPFNSTANPTEGPVPRAPGLTPCYLPEAPNAPAVATATTPTAAHFASVH